MKRVIPLEVTQNINSALIGSKAMSLIRLKRLGLPVPTGFCIIGLAYREHIEKNDLLPYIKSLLFKLQTKSELKKSLLAHLRQAIITAPLSETLKKEIENHYQRLAFNRVAVRSSATAEDLPGHSFAGQYETYLDVIDQASCVVAIKKCWSSLWTERVYEYREKNGFDHLDVNMAVIVQSLIPADASGVVFTVNPVTGQSNQLIIEACLGLGDLLVSGKVTPDHFIVAKDKLCFLEQTISDKKTKSIISQTGGVREQLLAVDESNSPTIKEPIALKLARLAIKVEKAFGSPQDIEWAVHGNKIFFLQSRPITTLPKPKSWEDRQIWTNANAGEVLPDVVTPLSWSAVNLLVMAIFNSVFSWIGLEFGEHPLVGRIAGRVYFNVNTLAGAFRRLPGFKKIDLTRILGGAQGKKADLSQLEIPGEDVPDFDFSLLKTIFKTPGFAYKMLGQSSRKADAFMADTKAQVEKLEKIDIPLLSEEELTKHVKHIIAEVKKRVEAIAFSGMGMFYFPNLDKICRKWLGDSEGRYANQLLAAVGEMDSAKAGLELWQLVARAEKYPFVKRVVLAKGHWHSTRQRLVKFEAGQSFLSAWDKFMLEHGHHTRGEIELLNPRWSETPDYILDMIRSYLKSIGQVDPLANYEKHGEERIRLTRKCRRELGNPIKRLIFNFNLSRAQLGCVARENIKSIAVKYWRVLRFMTLELGKRLVQRKILDKPEDIFFLYLEEIDEARLGKKNLKTMISARQAEHTRNLTITPPKVVKGKFDPNNFTPDAVDKTVKVLTGMAVSPGIVIGKARVILRTSADERVLPGEILVAPFTDPGWTPYFLTAAAIVMDQGGLLSHGSIVAREYGIPAVVNVGLATQIIKTGQIIQVNSNRGEVRIIK